VNKKGKGRKGRKGNRRKEIRYEVDLVVSLPE
jgi:hypothetical protein